MKIEELLQQWRILNRLDKKSLRLVLGGLLLLGLGAAFWAYLSSYLEEKGKQLAANSDASVRTAEVATASVATVSATPTSSASALPPLPSGVPTASQRGVNDAPRARLAVSLKSDQALPLRKEPGRYKNAVVYAETARCQITFGSDRKGDEPILITSISMETQPITPTSTDLEGLDYEVDLLNLVGHGIVEVRQYEFSLDRDDKSGHAASGRYMVDKDKAEPVSLLNILARKAKAETVAIHGSETSAHWSFVATVSVTSSRGFHRVRFVATYDVGDMVEQTTATRWTYVYKK